MTGQRVSTSCKTDIVFCVIKVAVNEEEKEKKMKRKSERESERERVRDRERETDSGERQSAVSNNLHLVVGISLFQAFNFMKPALLFVLASLLGHVHPTPPADRGNLRIYPPLPLAVRKRRMNEAAPACPRAAELTTNVNSDYLVTVSSNGRDEVMRYHCWRYIALVLICHKTTNKQNVHPTNYSSMYLFCIHSA